jgi:signal transduction histidine kinase
VKPAQSSLNSWVSSLYRSRQRIRLAFVAIVIFLFAQVIWWMLFQQQYIERSIQQTAMQWQNEAEFAEIALGAALPSKQKMLLEKLAVQSPHLNLSRPVQVNQTALIAFQQRQIRYLRMFAFEVPFFLLVMLGGLFIIWRSMQGDFELRRRQENFLMAATHEFRTPITSLRLLVQTAQYRELPREKQLDVLERMNLEVARLQDVSERVLATARLEQGIGVQPLSTQNWSEVLLSYLQKQNLEKRGVQLHLDLARDVRVALDPAAFEIVLSNLLENAIKYSPNPEKPIFIKLETKGSHALLSLEDRGIGIASAEIPHIFDQFYRVGQEMTRVAKGLGLGLYLVRGIVGLMHGSVSCESLPVGTRFVVRLPIAQSQAKPVLVQA